MDSEPVTAYQYANRLAAQQLKPLRDFVERTAGKGRNAKSGDLDKPSKQAPAASASSLSE